MRNTKVEEEEINDPKYSWLDGMDERLEILKVRWQGCKIGNTQG